jgi:hypothetical protein
METRPKSDGMSTTDLAIALVMLALMGAICAVGLELRRHIL